MGKEVGDPGGRTDHQQAPPEKPDPKMQAARVRLLDGTCKDFTVNRGADGEALFNMVNEELQMVEKEFFSLCFYTEGERHWLYNDKKIMRQLKGLPWEFSFEVKFYPTAPNTMNDDNARFNLFLQLRDDIYSGRLPATKPTHALLGSLVAQHEIGDATSSAEYEHFIRTAKIVPDALMDESMIEQMKELHRERKGLTVYESEVSYLNECRQLNMYGVFTFDAKDNKGNPIIIGVWAGGVNIYKEQIRLHRFAWQNIEKISYRKNQFAIKLKPGEVDKKKKTLVFPLKDYQHAKRVWKCAVEHHTFFRLLQPEKKPKQSFFRWGSARFSYQGRTQMQTKMASQLFDGNSTMPRSTTPRGTQSMDNVTGEQRVVSPVGYLEREKNELHQQQLEKQQQMSPSPTKSYDVATASEKRRQHKKNGAGQSKKAKQSAKGGKKDNHTDTSDSSSSSDDEKKQVQIVQQQHHQQESGQPHTTVASWSETNQLPDEVTTEYDEYGNRITRTVRTQQVKHTMQKQTFQNYVVDDNENPGVASVVRSREQLTPLGQRGVDGVPIIETHSRSVAYENPDAVDTKSFEGLGEFVSSKTVTSGNRTIETITYKTEHDGIIETHVEHRVTIHADAPIDHDAELSAAIMEATQMNPDMTVEKIEVRQETTA